GGHGQETLRSAVTAVTDEGEITWKAGKAESTASSSGRRAASPIDLVRDDLVDELPDRPDVLQILLDEADVELLFQLEEELDQEERFLDQPCERSGIVQALRRQLEEFRHLRLDGGWIDHRSFPQSIIALPSTLRG